MRRRFRRLPILAPGRAPVLYVGVGTDATTPWPLPAARRWVADLYRSVAGVLKRAEARFTRAGLVGEFPSAADAFEHRPAEGYRPVMRVAARTSLFEFLFRKRRCVRPQRRLVTAW